MTNKQKLKIIYVGAFLTILTLMYNFSYNYFIKNYETMEFVHNKKNVKNLIKNLNMQLDFINATVNSYSKWDAAYNFLKGKNSAFSHVNFRDIKLVKDLPLDFIIYTDLKDNIKLSISTKEHKKEFFEKVVRVLNVKNNIQSIFSEENHIFYILKQKVLQTDSKGEKVGYLYAGKLFDKTLFDYINSSFEKIDLIKKELYKHDGSISYNGLNNIRYQVTKQNNYITNYLELRDYKNRYIATIEAISYRDYIVQSKNTVVLFNVIISIILLVIFYLAYRYQTMMQRHTEKLKYNVAKRTKELEKSNKELYELAYKDFLTKIDNRRSFFLKMDTLLKDTIFRKDLVHVVMIDIDNFKQINDKYSHEVGDIVLKKFAEIIKNNISHKDLCARLGGEEFVIAFTDLSTKEVLQKVEKIRKETEQTTIILNSNKQFNFTASFGISDNKKTNNIDKILHIADAYLYEVKTTGKNNIRYR